MRSGTDKSSEQAKRDWIFSFNCLLSFHRLNRNLLMRCIGLHTSFNLKTSRLQHISGHFIMVTLTTVCWKITSVLLVNTHVHSDELNTNGRSELYGFTKMYGHAPVEANTKWGWRALLFNRGDQAVFRSSSERRPRRLEEERHNETRRAM